MQLGRYEKYAGYQMIRKKEYRSMKTSDFYYDLPQELIAQDPLEDRSSSRLLHLDKETGAIEHTDFKHILQYFYSNILNYNLLIICMKTKSSTMIIHSKQFIIFIIKQ